MQYTITESILVLQAISIGMSLYDRHFAREIIERSEFKADIISQPSVMFLLP
jgi:hypothetical protein